MSFQSLLSTVTEQLGTRYEVELALRELVFNVEKKENISKIESLLFSVKVSDDVSVKLLQKLDFLHKEKCVILNELQSIKSKSKAVREKFVLTIGPMLKESRQIQANKATITDLRMKLATCESTMKKLQERVDAQPVDLQLPHESPQAISTSTQIAEPKFENVKSKVSPVIPLERIYVVESLLDFENETLLNMFSFLTTSEVLNFAQSCRMLFKRVNQLFGMDSSVDTLLWDEEYRWLVASYGKGSPVIVRANGSSSHAHAEIQTTGHGSSNGLLVVSSKSQSTPTSSSTNQAHSTQAVVQQAVAAITPSSLAALLSSPLQSHGQTHAAGHTPSAPSVASSSANNPAATQQAAPVYGVGLGLSRDMAEALSKKLNPTELKAVAALADLLRKQNTQLAVMREERETSDTKLKAAENMRDFLVEKLRSAELALKSTLADLAVLRKQTTVDQEVISYLDLRGQELEGTSASLRREVERLQALHDLQQGRHSHLESRLQAELSECRARLEEQEASFKAQKKLLVKEVRSLRGQVDKVSAERSLYRSQLQALRDALLSAGGT